MDKEPIIEIRDLVKSFGPRRILDGVNLDIYKGETLVVMGGSGCGKSTLLRHIVGSLKPDSGKVLMKGKEISGLRTAELDELKKSFGMMFQSAALLDYMTVEENISLPLVEHTDLDPEVIKIMVKMKLELVGLRGFQDLKPSQLSGGMKKRVGIARAIAMDPEMLFCDEPTAGLDPIVAAVIDRLIVDLSKKLMMTSIVVTHDMQSVFRIADRIAMLHQGRVIAHGTPDEIRSSDNDLVKQFIEGNPDGPVAFLKQGDEYINQLME
ncbi:MAG: ABC transporter ATP-binding protein [Candidatus Omnitrophota bacterium]